MRGVIEIRARWAIYSVPIKCWTCNVCAHMNENRVYRMLRLNEVRRCRYVSTAQIFWHANFQCAQRRKGVRWGAQNGLSISLFLLQCFDNVSFTWHCPGRREDWRLQHLSDQVPLWLAGLAMSTSRDIRTKSRIILHENSWTRDRAILLPRRHVDSWTRF